MERLTKIERKFLKMCNTNDGMTTQKNSIFSVISIHP